MENNIIKINNDRIILSPWTRYEFNSWAVSSREVHFFDSGISPDFLDLEYTGFRPVTRWGLRKRFLTYSKEENQDLNYLNKLVYLLNVYLEDHFQLYIKYSDCRRDELIKIIDDYIVRLDLIIALE